MGVTHSSSQESVPSSDLDPWTDAALRSPYDLWSELRALAPAVYLRKYDLWALPRYAQVREALRNWEVFSSASGVALNERMNRILAGGTLCSDPPAHQVLRGIVRRPLTPRELTDLEPEIQQEADLLVDRLVARETFDAVADLARHLPLTMVSTRVGLPEDGRENMLDWAAANFNCFGPLNERAREAFVTLEEGVRYSFDPTLPDRLIPGGWAARLWQAADAGEIAPEQCGAMLNDYWGPSLDTTIFATASAIWFFAQFPDQWDLLRADQSLIPHAVNEVIRLESPIPQFSRLTTRDYEVEGVTIPSGSRVLMMFGSANRDERKWPDADRFDIARKPSDHVGFGYGEHACVGMPLARMEIRALLTALARRVDRFELHGERRAVNNMLRGFAGLDVTVRTNEPRG
jgi:cytochrome P450